MGRNFYQESAKMWQSRPDHPWAHRLNTMAKYVFSSTLKTTEWGNSTIISGDVVAEAATLKEAAYWGVDCYFYMEKYEETVRRYSALALRYQQQPEGLIALHQIWYCQHFYLREPEKAAAALGRLRETFNALPDAAFDGIMLSHRRDYWDKKLAEAERMASGTP